jgi:hypothetical protein
VLGSDWYGFDKKLIGSRYAKLVFLHPVGSVGHVVHSSSASGHETSTHYFSYSGWTGKDSTKSAPEHVLPNLFFLHLVGSARHVVHSGACNG